MSRTIYCRDDESVFAAAEREWGKDAKVLITGPGQSLDALFPKAQELGDRFLGYVAPRQREYFIVYRKS